MKIITRIIPGMILVIALVLAIFNARACADESETIEKQFNVKIGGTLTLESDRGSITVKTHANNTVQITVQKVANVFSDSRAENMLEDFEITFEQSGKDVEVEGRGHSMSSNMFNRLRVKYDLVVPREYNLKLRTAGGNIDVDDLDGTLDAKTAGGSLNFGIITGSVLGKTAGGSISLKGSSDDVEVETAGGSIRIGGVRGDVVAKTSGGSISIGEVNGQLTARTSGGGINIEGVTGAVNAKTSGGSVRATILNQLKDDCFLETSGGSIEVTIPENISLNLEARTSGGKIRTDLPITVKGELSKSRIEGVLNGGGPDLILRTSAGNIIINKKMDVL